MGRCLLLVTVLVSGCVADSTLRVTVDGTGSVTSNPPGIECGAAGGACAMEVDPSNTVELRETPPAVGADFTGWGGACGGLDACLVDMSSDASVTARFTPINHTLRIATSGTGAYRVDSDPAGISCGIGPRDCMVSVPTRTPMRLTASYDAASTTFFGWQGDATCTDDIECPITMEKDRLISTAFSVRLFLTVQVSGPGVVTGPGISCPGQCRAEVAAGTMVTLHPTPDASATFVGWLGVCPNMTDCTVTVQNQTTVTATFSAM